MIRPQNLTRDDGSTIPLILGFVILALLVVAASVAAEDAFVAQSNLQSVCDGAAAAAAAGPNSDGERGDGPASGYLRLSGVQRAVQSYLENDPARTDVGAEASVNADATVVTVNCERRSSLAFGSFFGFGSGLVHHATSAARSPVQP